MSFSFNFVVDESGDDISMNLSTDTITTDSNNNHDNNDNNHLRPAKIHKFSDNPQHKQRIEHLLQNAHHHSHIFKIETIKIPHANINYEGPPLKKVTLLSSSSLHSSNSPITQLLFSDTDHQHEDTPSVLQQLEKSDLIAGKYEGGFKLWECSFDVIQYLIEQSSSGSTVGELPPTSSNEKNSYLKDKVVLECGCGHGLPGLFAIHQGAQRVDFQDYNSEVISSLTMMNVVLTGEQRAIESSVFYSGDWQLLMTSDGEIDGGENGVNKSENSGGKRSSSVAVPKQSYDLILTSDTLYHTSSHDKLYRFMKHVLKPDGEILVAAKRYYFGCGGGVHDFKMLVERDGVMDVRTVREFTDGQSNVREILSLKFKK